MPNYPFAGNDDTQEFDYEQFFAELKEQFTADAIRQRRIEHPTLSSHSLFTAYKGIGDALLSFSAPITLPLILGAISALAAALTVICAAILLVSLVGLAISTLVNSQSGKELFKTSLVLSAVVGLASAAASAAFFIGAVLAFPLSIVNIFTRSAATGVAAVAAVGSGIKHCLTDDAAEENQSLVTPAM